MAKAWIRDRWLKSKAVVDSVELTPTTGMKRQVAANPDTADVPAALRTADYGRGMRWQVCWRADGRQHRESLPTREAAEARDGRELSLDTVIYDRSKKKGQTMIDTIDRGCLEGGCLDDEDLRIIFEHLLGRRRQGPGTLKGQAAY